MRMNSWLITIGKYWYNLIWIFRKRKRVLFSGIGKFLFAYSIINSLYCLIVIVKNCSMRDEFVMNKYFIIYSFVEILSSLYVLLMGFIFVISKIMTCILFKLNPKLLMKLKRLGVRKMSKVKNFWTNYITLLFLLIVNVIIKLTFLNNY